MLASALLASIWSCSIGPKQEDNAPSTGRFDLDGGDDGGASSEGGGFVSDSGSGADDAGIGSSETGAPADDASVDMPDGSPCPPPAVDGGPLDAPDASPPEVGGEAGPPTCTDAASESPISADGRAD